MTALGQKLSRGDVGGSGGPLTLTENAQPALMAVSLAALRTLAEEGGLALGPRQLSSPAIRSVNIRRSPRRELEPRRYRALLKTRGRAMQAAVPVGRGAMAALLGAELPQAQELAKAASDGEVCAAANDNAPGQVVISGTRAAIERAMALAPKYGARRAVLLPVSAPFHCALMQPAADMMSEALSKVTISAPAVPLVANVLASAISDPEAIRTRLIEQVTGMVRWRESMLYLRAQGVDTLYEVGAGRVLTGLARRFEGFEARSIGTPEELEAAATSLASLQS